MSAAGTKLNRRGIETRRRILATAFGVLSTGGPDAVSANLVARDAGVTWGTIQHQFGDADGLWAAVVDEHCGQIDRAFVFRPGTDDSIAERVDAFVGRIWAGMDAPPAHAVRNLRTALFPDRLGDGAAHPRTWAALAELDARWSSLLDGAFTAFGPSPAHVAGLRVLLPGAVRGMYLDTAGNPEAAVEGRRCLVEAVTAYLD